MTPLHKKMLGALEAAQADRMKRKNWIEYEQNAMFEAVNEERRIRYLPPVFIGDIINVERQALGHADYSRKFALYCAELAEGKSK